jgi:hypothetical protein
MPVRRRIATGSDAGRGTRIEITRRGAKPAEMR